MRSNSKVVFSADGGSGVASCPRTAAITRFTWLSASAAVANNVAALGACGLPLGAGFVSEWLLVQSLIHAAPGHDPIVALTTPLAVGVVALATGLSVAAMTKAFGIGFLARPRSGGG